MPTRSKLISDIELRLTKSKPSDDLELERSHIGHLLDITRDAMVRKELNEQIERGETPDSFYLFRETCVTPVAENLACVADDKDHYSHTLTYTPMDLKEDMGVFIVVTDEYERVQKTTLRDLYMINDLPFAKPSNSNMVYYRDNNKLVFLGLNRNVINDPTFIIQYFPQYTTSAIPDESAEFKVRDDMVAPLLEEVERILLRTMYNTEEDFEADGQQDIGNE